MAESKKSSIFVTGGAESAGLAAVRALRHRGHTVAAAAPDAAGALAIRQAGALPVYPDLTRESEVLSVLTMTKAEVIVHAAPQNFGGAPQADFDYAAQAQPLIAGSRALVGAAVKHGIKNLTAISFAYLYGDSDAAAGEDSPTVHGGEYAAMHTAEAALRESGLNGSLLRAGYIYGGHSRSTRALAALVKGSRPLLAGSQPAAWIHEDDLAAAIALLVESTPAGIEIINAADDHPRSPNEFASALSQAIGLGAPGFATRGLMMRLLRGVTLRDRLHQRAIRIDSSHLKSRGWAARHPDIEAGMEATTLVWRMQDASPPADFYGYDDTASTAIAALESGAPAPAAPAVPEPKPAAQASAPAPAKAAPAKPAAAPPPSDGPTPWNEDEAKREERRRKALERRAKRAAKRAGG